MFENWQRQVSAHFDELKTAEKKGFAEGKAEAEKEAELKLLETARKMILRGDSLESNVEVVDLSLEKVAQLRNELTPSGV